MLLPAHYVWPSSWSFHPPSPPITAFTAWPLIPDNPHLAYNLSFTSLAPTPSRSYHPSLLKTYTFLIPFLPPLILISFTCFNLRSLISPYFSPLSSLLLLLSLVSYQLFLIFISSHLYFFSYFLCISLLYLVYPYSVNSLLLSSPFLNSFRSQCLCGEGMIFPIHSTVPSFFHSFPI